MRADRESRPSRAVRMPILAMLVLLSRAVPASGWDDRNGDEVSLPPSVLAVTIGGGPYHPAGTPSTAATRVSGGVRLGCEPPPGFGADAFCLTIGGSAWSSPTENLVAAEGEAFLFYPGTRLLPFPNQIFYGAGIGAAQVSRDGTNLVSVPTLSMSGGLATRCGSILIEARLKLTLTHHDPVFDLSGPAVEIGAVCPFGW